MKNRKIKYLFFLLMLFPTLNNCIKIDYDTDKVYYFKKFNFKISTLHYDHIGQKYNYSIFNPNGMHLMDIKIEGKLYKHLIRNGHTITDTRANYFEIDMNVPKLKSNINLKKHYHAFSHFDGKQDAVAEFLIKKKYIIDGELNIIKLNVQLMKGDTLTKEENMLYKYN